MKRKVIDIYSDDMSKFDDQLNYKDSFLKKYGDKIDANDPFYFDGVDIVDGTTNETIRGANLERDSWNQITKVLIKYFHLDI